MNTKKLLLLLLLMSSGAAHASDAPHPFLLASAWVTAANDGRTVNPDDSKYTVLFDDLSKLIDQQLRGVVLVDADTNSLASMIVYYTRLKKIADYKKVADLFLTAIKNLSTITPQVGSPATPMILASPAGREPMSPASPFKW